MKKYAMALMLGTLLGALAGAGEADKPANRTPVEVAFVCPLQSAPMDWSVKGLRLTFIYGCNADVKGLDLGLIYNKATVDFSGLAASVIANQVNGSVYGLQLAAVANIAGEGEELVGLQFSAANLAGNARGIQFGFFNYCNSLTGVQFGLVSISEQMSGIQVGLYNSAHTLEGIQFGVVNVAEDVSGVQLGILNMNKTSPLPVSVLFNAGF